MRGPPGAGERTAIAETLGPAEAQERPGTSGCAGHGRKVATCVMTRRGRILVQDVDKLRLTHWKSDLPGLNKCRVRFTLSSIPTPSPSLVRNRSTSAVALECAMHGFLTVSLFITAFGWCPHILRQVRLYIRERDELALARHIFDQTRSTTVLHDLSELRWGVSPRSRPLDLPPGPGPN